MDTATRYSKNLPPDVSKELFREAIKSNQHWPPPVPSAEGINVLLNCLDGQRALLKASLGKHHELNLMRAERDRASLAAQRQEQERTPDPTLGVFTARERMGSERVLGVSIGFPLPGASRQWLATAAQADASAWADRVRQAELELGSEFDRRWLSARDLRQSLRHMAQAARIQQAAADQAWRAYALGEGTMPATRSSPGRCPADC